MRKRRRASCFSSLEVPLTASLAYTLRNTPVAEAYRAISVMALSQEQIAQGVAGLDADLSWILEDTGVERDVRGLIGHLKIRRLNTFAKLESSEEKFRELVKDMFGIDPSASPESRVQHALLVDAWDRARERLRVQANVEAEASAEGRVKPMPRGAQILLRKRFEEVFNEVPDAEYPAKDYLMDILETLEEQELVAEALTQVVSREQCSGRGSDDVAITIGTVKVRGAGRRPTAPLPKTPEDLRKTYRVMWNAWSVVRLKHPDRPELKGLGREAFEVILDYLLGPKCWEKVSGTGNRISWSDLLAYEHRIRRHAVHYVNRGKGTLVDGLQDALKDIELRNECFVEPMAMSARRRSRSPRRDPPKNPQEQKGGQNRSNKGAKGRAKGVGAGNDNGGKGGGDRASGSGQPELTQDQLAARTAVNKAKKAERLKWSVEAGGSRKTVCVRYNRRDHCDDRCRFAHVCLRCGGNHIIKDCPVAPTFK